MADSFGAKVSLPGFDAETAADANLYFNSSWPTLKIDLSISGVLTLTGNPSIDVITHNLGYPPFVMLWSKTNGFYPYYIGGINSTTIVLSGTNVSNNIGDSVRYYVFRNPLNINFLAPNIKLAATSQGTNHQDFGIKVTKPGKDASSTDLRDFTIHSGTKSLQVHQVIYQSLAQFQDSQFGLPNNTTLGLKYITDLPYRPVYFAFYSTDNVNFVPLFAASQTFPKVAYNTIDGGVIITTGSSTTGGWGVFYVLLDPYQSTNQVNITL